MNHKLLKFMNKSKSKEKNPLKLLRNGRTSSKQKSKENSTAKISIDLSKEISQAKNFSLSPKKTLRKSGQKLNEDKNEINNINLNLLNIVAEESNTIPTSKNEPDNKKNFRESIEKESEFYSYNKMDINNSNEKNKNENNISINNNLLNSPLISALQNSCESKELKTLTKPKQKCVFNDWFHNSGTAINRATTPQNKIFKCNNLFIPIPAFNSTNYK